MARDWILCGVLTFLAIGSTIACCLFAYGSGVETGMYVAAYFFMASALLAWWRVTLYLIDEAFGDKVPKFLSAFATPFENRVPLSSSGIGEPGVMSPKGSKLQGLASAHHGFGANVTNGAHYPDGSHHPDVAVQNGQMREA